MNIVLEFYDQFYNFAKRWGRKKAKHKDQLNSSRCYSDLVDGLLTLGFSYLLGKFQGMRCSDSISMYMCGNTCTYIALLFSYQYTLMWCTGFMGHLYMSWCKPYIPLYFLLHFILPFTASSNDNNIIIYIIVVLVVTMVGVLVGVILFILFVIKRRRSELCVMTYND